ncbi:MAG: amylo-alpha-1,6-glucosidase [Planctomycetota bacterium]
MSDVGQPLYSIETYGELRPHLACEWLLTNGTGAFSMGTVVGCNTRRYHGLLCAATLPPLGRVMALSRVGESLEMLDGNPDKPPIELGLAHFEDDIHPRGDRYLHCFELGDTARWHYDAAGVSVTKELHLLWDRNTAGLRYTIDPTSRGRVRFRLQPFVALRDFHALHHAAESDFATNTDDAGVEVRRDDLQLNMRCSGARFEPVADWWYGHVYPIETERGLDDREDLYTPGTFVAEVTEPTTLTLWATLDRAEALDWDQALLDRAAHLQHAKRFPATPSQQRLFHAADAFVVRRKRPDQPAGTPPRATTILAGYPWFGDWGRDTMIALPGILLTTGRFHDAGRVLSLFAAHTSEGMVPNRFDDYTSEPSYNTVDASLWFIHAAFEYLCKTRDQDTFDSILRPACEQIVDGYRNGTRFGIGVDPTDGLVYAGDASTQLTWMDAKVGETAFTPRHGKAVEINALWYHALRLMGDPEADRVAAAFVDAFWLAPHKGLADCVVGRAGAYERDESIRPNQIFAVSLGNSPLDREQQRGVVERVRRYLLTNAGLRSLSAQAGKYQGEYRGGQYSRDRAYHNGTVWSWLIGPFLDAYLVVNERSTESIEQARTWLRPLVEHLESGCIGHISEIFDADSPHRAVGCPAQAWSVAEVLRLAVELDM